MLLNDWLPETMDLAPEKVGVIVVDHGSRRAESNALLLEVVNMFQQDSNLPIVEPAHMELAEPSIAQAFDACVARGVELVVVFPYFLSPGRHWSQDIPKLAGEAAADHPGVKHLVTSPLGLHELMGQVMQVRIKHCLEHSLKGTEACDLCKPGDGCSIKSI